MIILILLFSFILGVAFGSFLNVLIDRLPQEQSIMGRSHCDMCRKKIAWYDLFPVVSFFILGRKCRSCRKQLSFFYPGVEILTGVVFLLTVWHSVIYAVNPLETGIRLVMFSALIVIFFADWKYQIIPDSMQLVFLLSALALHLVPNVSQSQSSINEILQQFKSDALSGFLVMLPILFLFLITRGRGMGFGDVKYAFSMGILLGIKGGYVGMYLGFVIGAFFGLGLILSKRKKLKSRIAFGPFLVLGTVLVLLYQDILFMWVRKIYGI